MEFYPLILTLHIVFAGTWIIGFITDIILKSFISKLKNTTIGESINLYLKMTNVPGIISACGILITGILMVFFNPGYGFFDMSSNHWLATKQILMVVLLVIVFAFIVPKAKKLRNSIASSTADGNNEEALLQLKKIYKLNNIIHAIVIINFLLAITHRYLN